MTMIRRFAEFNVRELDKESRAVEGEACVFNQVTDLGWFTEEIDPRAFDECDMSDVVLNLNHNNDVLLAGTRNGSLSLSIDGHGLKQRSTIAKTSQGDDVLELVHTGLLNKMSFAFFVNEDGVEWLQRDGKEHRIIKKIERLVDVSLVTFPAYSGTSAAARVEGLVDELALKHKEEREKMEEKNIEVVEDIEEVKEEIFNEEEPTVEEAVETKEEEREMNLNLDTTIATENVEQRMAEVETRSSNSKENIKRWRDAIMSGTENRAGLVSTDEGVPVPTLFQTFVETAWDRLDIIDEVTKSYVKGIFKVPYEKTADGAAYHKEGTTAPTEENLTLGVTTLTPVMIKKWISVTDELMALTDEEFMRYVADEVVYQVAKFLQNAIIAGQGQGDGNVNGVVGIINAALTQTLQIALNFNAGNAALAEVDGGDNPLAVMNRKTYFDNILGLTDLQGRPIYQILTDIEGRVRYFWNGIRVKFSDVLPAYDSATTDQAWAVIGNFKAYRLNLPEGENVKTLFDPYTLATEDKSRMLGRIFAAGNVVRPQAFAKLTKPAA